MSPSHLSKRLFWTAAIVLAVLPPPAALRVAGGAVERDLSAGVAAPALVTLQGRVYAGICGIEPPQSIELYRVKVTLYGSSSPGERYGTWLDDDTTDEKGIYYLEVPATPTYAYYNIVETDTAGFASECARSVSGVPKDDNWIQYSHSGLSGTLTGNKFWDQGPGTPTSTPTCTATATSSSTPTRTPTAVPPTVTPTPTATGPLPPTATPTPTGALPPTSTPTSTPTGTATSAVWEFSGLVSLQVDPERIPAPPGIAMGLFGSSHPQELGEPLATTSTAGDGFYMLRTTGDAMAAGVLEFPYLNIAVTDARYRVLDSWSESGGEETGQHWLQYAGPQPRHYPGNHFHVESLGGTATATATVTRTPTPTPTPGGPVVIDFCAVADAWVDETEPEVNHGAESTMVVGFGQGPGEPFGRRYGLMRFDLAWLPAGSAVDNALLELGLESGAGLGTVPVSVRAVADSWEEASVRWKNQPDVMDPPVAHTAVALAPTLYQWDIRTLVQQWVNDPEHNYGLELRGPEADDFWRRVFLGRHDTAACPRLLLDARPSGPVVLPTPTEVPTSTPTATPTRTPTATSVVCAHGDVAGNTLVQASALSGVNTGYVEEYICPAGDEDYWKFPVQVGQTVNLSLSDLPDDYDLYLYGPYGGAEYESSTHTGTATETISYTIPVSSGDWRARVVGKDYNDWSGSSPYRLSASVCFLEDSGSSLQTATTISSTIAAAGIQNKYSGYICPSGDQDWYKFYVSSQPQTVSIKLSNLPAEYHLSFYLPDGSFAYYDKSAGTGDKTVTLKFALSASDTGYWRILVEGGSSSAYHSTKPYQLEVTQTADEAMDLQVQGVEVTQVVQDLAGSVPLIEGKPTWARVYIGTGTSSAISSVPIELHGWTPWFGGTALPGSPLKLTMASATNATLAQHRASVTGSANFLLPSTWVKGGQTIALQAVVNPQQTLVESNYSNNSATTYANCSSRSEINLWLVPVRANDIVASYTDPHVASMLAWLLAVMPTDSVAVWTSAVPFDADYDYSEPSGEGCSDGWSDLVDKMEDHYENWTNHPSNAFVYGMLDPDIGLGDTGGCGSMSTHAACGNLAGTTIAHEMGHNMGRMHSPCGDVGTSDPNWPSSTNPGAIIGEVGVNVAAGVNNPFNMPVVHAADSPDLMSYCPSPWVAPYTYNGFFQHLSPFATSSTAQEESAHLLVSGAAQDGHVEPRPFWVVGRPAGSYDYAGEGPYSLELQNGFGEVLFVRHFASVGVNQGQDHPKDRFRETVPFVPGAVRVVFRYEGEIVHTVEMSPSPPVVQVLGPNGGEAWDGAGPYAVSWQAADADGDALLANVNFSNDGGLTWKPLASNLETGSYEVEPALLPGGDNCLVQVVVSDGFNTRADVSDAPFHVARKAPLAILLGLSDGQQVTPGQQLVLQGLATDPEDGPLPTEALTWLLDGGIALGTGNDVHLDGLAGGDHQITLRVTDGDGMDGSTSVDVFVGLPLYVPLVVRQ